MHLGFFSYKEDSRATVVYPLKTVAELFTEPPSVQHLGLPSRQNAEEASTMKNHPKPLFKQSQLWDPSLTGRLPPGLASLLPLFPNCSKLLVSATDLPWWALRDRQVGRTQGCVTVIDQCLVSGSQPLDSMVLRLYCTFPCQYAVAHCSQDHGQGGPGELAGKKGPSRCWLWLEVGMGQQRRKKTSNASKKRKKRREGGREKERNEVSSLWSHQRRF